MMKKFKKNLNSENFLKKFKFCIIQKFIQTSYLQKRGKKSMQKTCDTDEINC
jgi:hypothetical protein